MDMSSEALLDAFQNSLEITNKALEILCKFWELFRASDTVKVYQLAETLGDDYHFLLPTIKAWQENRPKNILRQIISENKQADFWTIFNKFKEKKPFMVLETYK